jgi:hypothetical protein
MHQAFLLPLHYENGKSDQAHEYDEHSEHHSHHFEGRRLRRQRRRRASPGQASGEESFQPALQHTGDNVGED